MKTKWGVLLWYSATHSPRGLFFLVRDGSFNPFGLYGLRRASRDVNASVPRFDANFSLLTLARVPVRHRAPTWIRGSSYPTSAHKPLEKDLATPLSSPAIGTIGHHTGPGKSRPLIKDMSKEDLSCNTIHRGLSDQSWTFLLELTCSTHTPVIVIIAILRVQMSLLTSARALPQRGFCRLL